MHFEEIKELEPVSRRVIPKTKFIIWNILKPVLDFKLSKTLKTAFFCYHTKKVWFIHYYGTNIFLIGKENQFFSLAQKYAQII